MKLPVTLASAVYDAAAAIDMETTDEGEGRVYDLRHAERHLSLSEILYSDFTDALSGRRHPRLSRALRAELVRQLLSRGVVVVA